ncbi:MAG: YicC family protein [Bacteroidales bacterium]|nr:YicC family protein [Bacteroidales bacterium]
MLQSMTGFGKAIKDFENKKITVEIRTLNSKQADISAKIPALYREKEMELRNLLTQNLKRGKIELNFWIEENESTSSVVLNMPVINDYYHQLQETANFLNRDIKKENILEIIMRMPEVLKTELKELDENEWTQILKTVDEALIDIKKFRLQEGKVLQEDFDKRVHTIEELLDKIEPFEKERITKVKERIKQHFQDNIKDVEIDQNRFEQELIYYLEKFDITEEKVRLKNHCNYFRQTLSEKESQGKKLGFISQEIGREINTLGSKANHSEIQKIVVQMKDELEKIKEQVLNVL